MGEAESKLSYTYTHDNNEMNEDAIVLSYEDSLLYQADVKLLEPGGWINDKIVGFAFE